MKCLSLQGMGMVRVQVIFVREKRVALGSDADGLETVVLGIFFVRLGMGIVGRGNGAVRMGNGGEGKESVGACRESDDEEESVSDLKKKIF